MTPRTIIVDLASVTWRILVPTLFGAGLGYLFDYFLGTRAICFLVFSALGLIIGCKSALALVNGARKESNTFDDDIRRRSPRKFDS